MHLRPDLLLLDGTVLVVLFGAFVVGTLLWRPRIWLHDFPPDLQARMPEKTAEERRLTTLLAVPWLALLFGGLIYAGVRFGVDHGYLDLALHVYLLWQIVNLFDLVVIDWGGMHLVDPRDPPFEGTEGAKGYRDWGFHFVAYLKGSVMGVPLCALVAAVAWLIA